MTGITHKKSRNTLFLLWSLKIEKNYQIRRLFNKKEDYSTTRKKVVVVSIMAKIILLIKNNNDNSHINDNIKTLTIPMILTRITFLKSLTYQFPLSSIS